MAATFDFRSEAGESLSDVARLDTMVTVVDAVNLLKTIRRPTFCRIAARRWRATSSKQTTAACPSIGCSTPAASTSRRPSSTRYKELYGFAEHVPESEEYGVKNFVYRAVRPFDPVKFDQFIKQSWPGVIRAKGHFWLATRPQWLGEISQAGSIVRTEALGFWRAAVPAERWPDDPLWRKDLRKQWNEIYGDRRQEIVFIGVGMDEGAIRARLDACLVPGRPTMDVAEWAKLPDPFPAWLRADQAA
ncbi:G3E family GTPase [Bradyrhizobium niftali]